MNLRQLGGFFDGDGSPRLRVIKRSDAKYGYCVSPVVCIHLGKPRVDIDWISGFFDAEGGGALSIGKMKACKFGYRISPQVTIAQTNVGILEEIQNLLGFGGVHIRKDGSPCWYTTSREDCRKFINLMIDKVELKKPHLIVLREAISILDKPRKWKSQAIRKQDYLQLLHLAEIMNKLNGSKKSKNLVAFREALTPSN